MDERRSPDIGRRFSDSRAGNGTVRPFYRVVTGRRQTTARRAPPDQQLTPGTYTNATGDTRIRGRSGLSVSGNAHGCNRSSGSFTVTDAVYGPGGTILRFRATFEQRCEGSSAALRGELSLNAPPFLDVFTGCFVSSAGLPDLGRSR